jgi:8-oxo-dGTP diphosphatase
MKHPRPNLKARVVAKAAVFRNDRILLLHRATTASDPGTWDLPGGHVEEGETLTRAARREIREETGLSIRLGKMYYADVFGSFSKRGKIRPTVGVYFHCVSASPRVPHLDPAEHADFAWVGLSDLRSYPTVPHLHRAVQAAFATKQLVRAQRGSSGRPTPVEVGWIGLPVPT